MRGTASAVPKIHRTLIELGHIYPRLAACAISSPRHYSPQSDLADSALPSSRFRGGDFFESGGRLGG